METQRSLQERTEEYLKFTRSISDPVHKIPYDFPEGPQLPEWDYDFPNRVGTLGIKFSQGYPLQTEHLTVCVPVIVRAGDMSGLLHVAGGLINDVTIPRSPGEEPIVHRQRTELQKFIKENPLARALIVRSSGSNDWMQVVDRLMAFGIPLEAIINLDFKGQLCQYEVAYRPNNNQVLVKNPLVKEVWVFDGFSLPYDSTSHVG